VKSASNAVVIQVLLKVLVISISGGLMSTFAFPPNVSDFDSAFWMNALKQLSFPLKPVEMDLSTLKGQRALPSDLEAVKVLRLYSDDYAEVVIVEFERKSKLGRSLCTRTARSWKENRLIKPLLIFTNGTDSFAVIVPGKGIGGEAKVLGLSDRLYRTDLDVLESMKFPGSAEELSRKYDAEFFPYEKVRDAFFQGYRDLYERVEKAVKKEIKSESTSYAQRFLGRLMFLYFLQRKGWLAGNKRFIDSINNYRELNKLFYESLNQEGVQGVPFLNGSLFEREPYMSKTLESTLYPKMDKLFKEARDFLNQYNFTVDETLPLEVQVSIDPALIGTVFENMLPEYERGSKGTFYTPRVESSFICRRALSNYLGFQDEISQDGKTFRDGLIKYLEVLGKSKSEKEVREFREKLLSLRVLDPAVGSGGFLLVMMQEIIGLIQEAEAVVGWKSDVESYKKKILPNLYGFDIEPEAIEIARLRLWLSLIIDQKEPEPLPNLDMNIIVIKDSLRLPESQRSIDPRVEAMRETFGEIKAKYLNEHDSKNKKRLKEELRRISDDVARKTGTDPNVIEAYIPELPDVVVMNPPFVRHQSLPKKMKLEYSCEYGLDKRSDLYNYFILRALRLLSPNGVFSIISSDKWLEVDSGLPLQDQLRNHLIAVFGQRRRSFGADVNTVITVCSKKRIEFPVHFISLESYGRGEIRQVTVVNRKNLKPAKWFYLRVPKVFSEEILPRLTRRLSDFAEIKQGYVSGANDFFYVTDVSHFYEPDHLADPKRMEEWGVKARTRSELKAQGLIYVENEVGERFVIEAKSTKPLLRSIRDLSSPHITTLPNSLVLSLDSPIRNGLPLTLKYIHWGEKRPIEITRGANRRKVVGFNSLSAPKARHTWYVLPNLRPAKIALAELFFTRLMSFLSDAPVLADHLFDLAYPLNPACERAIWLYLNSTIYFMTLELWSPRMGGGALHPRTIEYKGIPTPDLEQLAKCLRNLDFGDRPVLPYNEEIKQTDKIALDTAILFALGFDAETARELLSKIYTSYLELVADRVTKSGKSLTMMQEEAEKTLESTPDVVAEEEVDDTDN
jgi:hypothetical protein